MRTRAEAGTVCHGHITSRGEENSSKTELARARRKAGRRTEEWRRSGITRRSPDSRRDMRRKAGTELHVLLHTMRGSGSLARSDTDISPGEGEGDNSDRTGPAILR